MTNNTDDHFGDHDLTVDTVRHLNRGKSPFQRHQEVRRKDPVTYWSHAYHKRLHAQALRMRESFYEPTPTAPAFEDNANERNDNE
jgi:hypothetical protein